MIWRDHNFEYGPHIRIHCHLRHRYGPYLKLSCFLLKFPDHIFEAIEMGQKARNLRQLLICIKSA